ncbi:MAG: hypothetical protein IAE94_06490 [Chthoniobacterales bacterium]|nr:hypothetical protein [Chthoniobacterales bacterium]
MKLEYPIFEAQRGTVISIFSTAPRFSSICGYCRAVVMEDDLFRFVGGFRRYTDPIRRVSWAEPVAWRVSPIAQVSLRIVHEKPWMQFNSRPEPDKIP